MSKSSLPSPNRELSCTVPSSAIAAANQQVSELLPAGVTEHPTQSVSLATQRGIYVKFTPKQRATVGNYTIAVSLSGSFLPLQLVYQGKTSKCHPSIDFLKGWYSTNSSNRWCNDETMMAYIQLVIVPYVQEK